MSDELEALKIELAELAASLKPSHLALAKGLAEGKSQEQAWIDAGSKAKNPNADAAKTIAKYPAVIQYKNLLLKIVQLESLPKQVATLQQKRQMLWDIATRSSILKVGLKGSEDPDTGECTQEIFDATAAKTAVAAIAELNKMDGDLAAVKTDNKHTHNHEELTEEQLDKRLAELQRKAGASAAS